MLAAAEVYGAAWRAGWLPDPDLYIDEWADANVVLSAKGSPEPGRYRTARTPYCREPMRELSPRSRTKRIALMWAAQTGKTSVGLCFKGFVVDKAPGPFLGVQPTVDIAKKYSKQRITPLIEETPTLRAKVKPSRERDSGNTVLVKEFDGGILMLTGANSAAGLRAMPIRYLHGDEIDAWPSDVEGEGDPVTLAEKRTTAFSRRKILLTSTPTLKGASRIEHEFQHSDQRRYFVPCPHCNEFQWLKWGGADVAYGIKWEPGKPKTARYVCEHCGADIQERHKTWMLERGQWRATAAGDGETVGFHLSALYSPMGWKSWSEIVDEWNKAQGNREKLKAWVNTVLAETWEEEYAAKVGADKLRERGEAYRINTVPDRGLVLVASMDTQGNRVALKIKAYGEGEESWLVNYAEIYGDPARIVGTADAPSVWDQVGTALDMPYEHASGAKLHVRVACVDSGGDHTHEVYQFVRHRMQLFNAGKSKCLVVAIKGASRPGRPIIGKPTKVDINFRDGTILKDGCDLYLIGTDTAKATIYGRLKIEDDGPGCMHFPLAGLPDDYYEMLTAERQVLKYSRGFQSFVWEKPEGARNEALDAEVYGLAAFHILLSRVNQATVWQQLREHIHAQVTAGSSGAPVVTAAPGRRMRSPGVGR